MTPSSKSLACVLIAVSSFLQLRSSEAAEFYQADGRWSSLSGMQLLVDSQLGGKVAAMTCLEQFVQVKNKIGGSADGKNYLIDYKSLASGKVRYLLSYVQNCEYDSSSSIETCEWEDLSDGSTPKTHGVVTPAQEGERDAYFYRYISDDEWAEYRVTGQLPSMPLQLTMQFASGVGMLLVFRCTEGVSITDYLVDDPQASELREARQIYNSRHDPRSDALPFSNSEWKTIIGVLGNQ